MADSCNENYPGREISREIISRERERALSGIPLSGRDRGLCFSAIATVHDGWPRTRNIETGLKSLRTRRPGPVVGRQKVGAHARLFVDRDEKRRALSRMVIKAGSGDPGGPSAGREEGTGRERGQNNPGPAYLCARVYVRTYTPAYVESFVGHSVPNARIILASARIAARSSPASSCRTDPSREQSLFQRQPMEFQLNGNDIGRASLSSLSFFPSVPFNAVGRCIIGANRSCESLQ